MLNIEELKSAEVFKGPAAIERLCKRAADEGICEDAILQSGATRISKSLPHVASFGAPAIPNTEELKSLAVARNLPWRDEYAGRAIGYWASTEQVDAHGDIVRQNWSFELVERNPAMPFGHDYGNPPVGKLIDWRILNKSGPDYVGPALYVLGLFATKDIWEKADTIFNLVKAGFLVGGSVGFFPETVIDVKDEKERAKLGLGRYGLILDDNHLLEFSPTTLGANPGAEALPSKMYEQLCLAKSRDLIRVEDIDGLREMARRQLLREQGGKDRWSATDALVRSFTRSLFNATLPAHKDAEQPLPGWEPKTAAAQGAAPAESASKSHVHLRMRVEEDSPESIESLARRLDALQAVVNEGLSSASQQLNDVRELLEGLAAEKTVDVVRTVASKEEHPAEREAIRSAIQGLTSFVKGQSASAAAHASPGKSEIGNVLQGLAALNGTVGRPNETRM